VSSYGTLCREHTFREHMFGRNDQSELRFRSHDEAGSDDPRQAISIERQECDQAGAQSVH